MGCAHPSIVKISAFFSTQNFLTRQFRRAFIA
jgi:hypothetical protein